MKIGAAAGCLRCLLPVARRSLQLADQLVTLLSKQASGEAIGVFYQDALTLNSVAAPPPSFAEPVSPQTPANFPPTPKMPANADAPPCRRSPATSSA
jgi:hypothetical protein